MNLNDDCSMDSYLRTRFHKILKDKERDKNIQNYLCSFVLVYWDSIVRIFKKDMVIFLSEIFGISKQKMQKYLTALESFKNATNLRNECLSVKIN